MYKDGQHVKPPGYQEALEAEASLVSEILASPEEREYLARGRSHDEWAMAYGEDTPALTTPRNPSTASMAQSPNITSPPLKHARTSASSGSQGNDDADEEAARSMQLFE